VKARKRWLNEEMGGKKGKDGRENKVGRGEVRKGRKNDDESTDGR
jgi:hypothetical protein